MKNDLPTILIIFGVSGDLSKRFLLPALGQISSLDMLPENFHIIGVTRQKDISIESLLQKTFNKDYLMKRMTIEQMDVDEIKEYKKLEKRLEEIEKKFGAPAQRLFYLSIPPQVSKPIIEKLGDSGLAKKGQVKLLLEKPFGINLKNAEDLAKHIDQFFDPEQVYRVDHYMAKDTAQNILVFRNGNSLFKKTWNNVFIDSIEIVASEAIGIEGRANFYEQTGALRDIVQSHLLQLLSLVLMEIPQNFEEVPAMRLKALKHLKIKNIKNAIRGQYEGYKEEVKNPESKTETFVSLTLESSDRRWSGVPLTLSTGKALNQKCTEIRILFKKDKDNESNELFLHLQPEEGIQFNMWAKRPGYEHRINPHNLSFKFKEYYNILPEAYEQVLYNAINGDHGLFTTSEEILETWRILDDLQKRWEKGSDDVLIYKKGATINEVKEKVQL